MEKRSKGLQHPFGLQRRSGAANHKLQGYPSVASFFFPKNAVSKPDTTMAKVAPGLGDELAAKQVDRQQYDEPPRHPEGTLHRPGELVGVSGRVRGTGGREGD